MFIKMSKKTATVVYLGLVPHSDKYTAHTVYLFITKSQIVLFIEIWQSSFRNLWWFYAHFPIFAICLLHVKIHTMQCLAIELNGALLVRHKAATVNVPIHRPHCQHFELGFIYFFSLSTTNNKKPVWGPTTEFICFPQLFVLLHLSFFYLWQTSWTFLRIH